MINSIVGIEWECPFCHERQKGEIQIKYGVLSGRQYAMGDKLSWERPGVVYEERLPGGNGSFDGIVSCRNNWKVRLRSGREGKDVPAKDFDPRSPAQIQEFGCPEVMRINVSTKDDIIVDVWFSKNIEEIFKNL